MIELTIKVKVKDLKDMVKNADMEIKDEAKFDKLIKSKKFQEDLAADILNVWQLQNECAEGDLHEVVQGLFGEELVDFN